MSAIVGVFWRTNGAEAAALAAYSVLKREIGLPADARWLAETRLRNSVILKFDFGAYGSPAFFSESGATSTLCGHPYVAHLRGAPRDSHLRYLAAAAREGRHFQFAQARGSFSFAFVDESECQLALAVDCLGIRPLYYADDGEKVVFSSTLAPFRGLGECVTGARDERAVVETAVFGYPLADRTEWRCVRCVPPGCALVFGDQVTQRNQFWCMSRVPQSSATSQEEALAAVFQSFGDAVGMRVADEAAVMAYLSGGMDSRAVVSILRSMNVQVNSLNFGASNSQDLVFGRMIAAALGCRHTEVPMDASSVLESIGSVQGEWEARLKSEGREVCHPHLVWSGDGGSLTLGHVYLTHEMVAAAESGEYERAVDILLPERGWMVPRGVLRKGRVAEIVGYPKRGLLEALAEQLSHDPGRRLHMMLMATDQRRHLHPHFELIYEHRCELQLPFFDRELVETVISRPVRPFLYHRFYNQWFELLPKEVMAIPWQTYPGHEPCPVATPGDLIYQWTAEYQLPTVRLLRRKYLARSVHALVWGAFCKTAISGTRVAMAWVATVLRLRDLTYALRFATFLADR